MTWEIIFVLVLTVATIASFLLEKIPADQTSLSVLALLIAGTALSADSDLPTVGELLRVFASPAPLTIGAMFVLSAALEKCGVIESLASYLSRLAKFGFRRCLLLLTLCVSLISAFVNNTPVVMVFLPVVLSLSRTMKLPASKFLIPLSYASIFGGCCTLVGTSTNILASGVVASYGFAPIGMFELAPIALPLLVLGLIYVVLFADRLLAPRDTLTSMLSPEERKEFLVEAFVQHDSPLAGKTVTRSGLLKDRTVRILELVRNNVAVRIDSKRTTLEAGDRLILGCRPSGVAYARTIDGLALGATSDLGIETISAHEGSIVEGVIGPRSSIIGQTAHQLRFRQRFRVILMAIHRRGVNVRDKLHRIPLQAGDLLLMMGTDQALDGLRRSDDVYLLDHPPTPSRSQRRKAPWVAAITAGVVMLASFEILPIEAAAILGVAAIFATRCLAPKEGYAAIEWGILLLIFGMLALGMAMEKTGAAALLARGLTQASHLSFVSEAMRPHLLLGALYFVTMLVTEILSNNATVALMTPLALSLGASLGVDPRPFVIATCLASSASFSTPIGYQTNTYVYAVGGYRFSDFVRFGLPLNLLYFVASVLLIPRIWSF
jgi:di/tricarboxylate transporter